MLSYTWENVLSIPSTETIFEIGFTSNGQHFDKMSFQRVDEARYIGYWNGSNNTIVYDNGWNNTSFKKITFDTLPPPELLTFMESRASVDAKVSKVEINGATLIDISNDTVAANILAKGYTAHDKTGNTITGTLMQQPGKTVTPGTSDVVAVESGKYTTGTVYIKGDSNLTADNIKSGISIFGVTGTYAGSGGGGSSGGTCNIQFNKDYIANMVCVLNSVLTEWDGSSDTFTVQQNSIITVISHSEVTCDNFEVDIFASVFYADGGIFYSSIFIGNVDEVTLVTQ